MKDANLEIYCYSDEDLNYSNEDTVYAGTFNTKETIKFKIQIWNNRFGTEQINEAENTVANIRFENFEDTMLLMNCKYSVNGSNLEKVEVTGAIASIPLGNISGKPNNGEQSNFDNYKEIILSFDLSSKNVYECMKTLCISVKHSTSESED